MYKDKVELKKKSRERIRKRIRKKVKGTSLCPRVFIFKSNRYLYTQAIDDEQSQVIVSASTLEKEFKEKQKNYKNIEASRILGDIMAKKLQQKKISRIVFDRGAYPYHGRVKALAEAMRKGGLKF